VLVSLSGIRPATLEDCSAVSSALDARGVRVSLLVVPCRLGAGTVLEWLRQRVGQGDAVVLHGYDHTPDPLGCWGSNTVARLGRRAEFATLPAHEAGLRLRAASILLDRLGLSTDVFIPPRWLASPGTLRALPQHGYRICADATAVRDLGSGQVWRARVLGLAALGLGSSGPVAGRHAEPWLSRALALAVARAARRGGLVRLAVDAAELAQPSRRSALLDAVDLALAHGARPSTYGAVRV
jgi:predicted deacetylase